MLDSHGRCSTSGQLSNWSNPLMGSWGHPVPPPPVLASVGSVRSKHKAFRLSDGKLETGRHDERSLELSPFLPFKLSDSLNTAHGVVGSGD